MPFLKKIQQREKTNHVCKMRWTGICQLAVDILTMGALLSLAGLA